METKVKKREWVKTALIIFLAVLLVLTFFSNTIMNASLPEVAAQRVEGGQINAKIRGQGMVSANETYDVTISQTRKVGSVLVKVGDEVETGDALFLLEAAESDELQQARDALADMELSYQKSLIDAGNAAAQDNHQVKLARDDYNDALKVYNQYSSMDSDQLTAKTAAVEAELKALQRAQKDADEALAEAQADSEYTDLQTDVAEKQAKVDEAQAKLDELERGQSLDKKDFNKLIAEKNEEISKLSADPEYATRESAVSEAEMALENANNSDDYLFLLNDLCGGSTTSAAVYGSNYDSLVRLLVQDHAMMPEDAKKTATKVQDAYQAIFEAEESLRLAEENFTEQEAKMAKLKSERDALIAEKEAYETNQSITDIYNAAKRALSAAERALANAEDDLDDYEKQIKYLKSAAEDAADACEDKQEELEDLNSAASAAETVKSTRKALEELIFQNSLGDSSSLDMQRAKDDIEKQKDLIKQLTADADGQEVVAKVSGKVSEINVTAGNTVGAEMPLCTINVADRGYVIKIPVTSDQAKKVKAGDKADLVNYWGGDVEAVLEQITADPQSPQTSKLLVFRLTGDVTPDQNLTLSIGQKSAFYDTLVPNSAVKQDSNGSFVLVLTAKTTPLSTRYTARRVDVQVMAADDTYSAVSGLSGGDFVITTSAKPIEAGSQVRLVDD